MLFNKILLIVFNNVPRTNSLYRGLKVWLMPPIFKGVRKRFPISPPEPEYLAALNEKMKEVRNRLIEQKNVFPVPPEATDPEMKRHLRAALHGHVKSLEDYNEIFKTYRYKEPKAVLWLFEFITKIGNYNSLSTLTYCLSLDACGTDLDKAEVVFNYAKNDRTNANMDIVKLYSLIIKKYNQVGDLDKSWSLFLETMNYAELNTGFVVSSFYELLSLAFDTVKGELGRLEKCLEFLSSETNTIRLQAGRLGEELLSKSQESGCSRDANYEEKARLLYIPYSAAIKTLGKMGRLKQAETLFSLLEELKVQRPIQVHNALLSAFVDHCLLEDSNPKFSKKAVVNLFEAMRDTLEVDIETYSIIFKVCDVKQIMDYCFDVSKNQKLIKNTSFYQEAITSLIRNESWDDAVNLFNEYKNYRDTNELSSELPDERFNKVLTTFNKLWADHVSKYGQHEKEKPLTRGQKKYIGNLIRHKLKEAKKPKPSRYKKELPDYFDRPRF